MLFERIVLTGFMGSGKSTAGQLLAKRLGWDFIDLDGAVERRDGRSVPSIFAESGEAHFRRLEAEELERILHGEHAVIALGGGAIETPQNNDLLKGRSETAVVFLSAPFDLLVARCNAQAADPLATATLRPNLADTAAARARFVRRQPLYAAASTHTVDCAALTPEQTVERILEALHSG